MHIHPPHTGIPTEAVDVAAALPREMTNYGAAHPLVSVIMPVYNVHKYLRQAVDSVIAQSYHHWELLLVDDGSTDGCAELCDDYSARDSRIKTIHQPNAGQAVARNNAITASSGQYVMFVDSDDWIEPDMMAALLEAIVRDKADMAMCGYMLNYVGRSKPHIPTISAGVHDNATLMAEGYLDNSVQSISCDKMFSRPVVSEGYPAIRYYEDHRALLHWFANVRVWTVLPRALYHYRMRRSGVTNSFSPIKRMAKFEADIERAVFVSLLSPQQRKYLSDAMIAAEVVRSAVNAAKTIARESSNRMEALQYLSHIAELAKPYSESASPAITPKVANRFKMLSRSPERFMTRMRLSGLFALAGKRKQTILYD